MKTVYYSKTLLYKGLFEKFNTFDTKGKIFKMLVVEIRLKTKCYKNIQLVIIFWKTSLTKIQIQRSTVQEVSCMLAFPIFRENFYRFPMILFYLAFHKSSLLGRSCYQTWDNTRPAQGEGRQWREQPTCVFWLVGHRCHWCSTNITKYGNHLMAAAPS